MELKFHKRADGTLFVKFDEIAQAWIHKHLVIDSISKKISLNASQKLSSYEANRRRSRRMSRMNRMVSKTTSSSSIL